MSDLQQKFLSNVLDCIEQKESRLLIWGIVDGLFQRDELSDLISPLIDSALESGFDEFFDTDEVIAALLALKLLVEIEGPNGEIGYRSRMAETVRLLQRLRQLFPKHARQSNGWQQAPTLVADFRFQRRRRQYPRRDISRDVVLEHLAKVIDNPSLLVGIQGVLGSNDKKISLAGFQVRATERILRGIENNEPLATIVCAGTGSGKTLAFYLPALASITRHLLRSDKLPWVKSVALYPRSELLKDQLREVIKRTTDLGAAVKGISVRVGALYGDTPTEAKYLSSTKSWRKVGKDYVCPSLKCIICNGEMHWHEVDHSVSRERLKCHDCNWVIEGDVFPLTRKSLAALPPDILFTTTEMLNQRLSDNGLNHLFGVGANTQRPPELVLLDEVHTYEGRHGAQVAYLMRRWAHLVERPLRFVGLSATLREATSFFACLTGAWQSLVEEISPLSSEIESEGAEYMIALRGDPVSRAALLSSTIQTTMLLERCLDPKTAKLNDSVSKGLFGQRTFVFTDDLDVTNRLFFNLLNAEGRKSNKDPDMHNAPNGGLAVLRRDGPSLSRYRGGQDWRMCEQLGHQLSERLYVDRVSSQDRGINTNADVVVATAALEVGFDDPSVGAVIQHKAPKSMAGFLQRKGRAGRTRGMRPWTAVVLSDYGRDRIAYQNYDLLFDPELPARTLPLSNRYITRMQAVFTAIDYFGQKLQDASKGSVWADLSGPNFRNDQRKYRLIKEIRSILESPNSERKFEKYLSRALKIPQEEVSALLWEYPRPLMTMAFPTALRRLTSGWSSYGKEGLDVQIRNNPLPDFVPATLFADLNLAEVQIQIPLLHAQYNQEEQYGMSVFSAMREFAPGRVSRRFAVHYHTGHWIAPSDDALSGSSSSDLPIDQFGTYVYLGKYGYWKNDVSVEVPVFRPVTLSPTSPPKNITDTSQAHLKWFSQFVPMGRPIWLPPPVGSVWNTLVLQVGFFTHASHAPIEVRRFAIGSNAEVGIGSGEKITLDINFSNENEPVALGAAFAADGVLFQVQIPSQLFARVEDSSPKWRALRTTRYFDSAWKGEALSTVASPFMRKWLAEVFMSAITFEAIQVNVDLETAAKSIVSGSASINLSEVLLILFQSQATEAQENVELPIHDRLRSDLDELIVRSDILEQLMSLGKFLWEPVCEEWESWLRKTYQCTLGVALLRTIGDLCPTINPDDLSIDLDRGPLINAHLAPCDDSQMEIWITEKSPGGNGLIEEFMRSYAEDPRRFFSMVRASMEMGEFELIDHQLFRLLNFLVKDDSDTKDIIREVRSTNSHEELLQATRALRLALLRDGFSPFHGFLVSMGNRILRPGAGPATDAYLLKAIERWIKEEERLGLEIDLRVICYWLSQAADIDAVVSETGIPGGEDRNAWRMSAIYGLLWGRGREIRQSSLQVRSQFSELPPVERLLVIDSFTDDCIRVSVESSDWMDTTTKHLAQGKLVTLTCVETKRTLLGSALHALITNPVETGYLRAYARLQGVRQTNNLLEADIELMEAVQ
jgi:hypothetical protein